VEECKPLAGGREGRQHQSTKHTNSFTKSSIKMGEMEYSQFNQYVIIKDLAGWCRLKRADSRVERD
jgi:hypothetical protein